MCYPAAIAVAGLVLSAAATTYTVYEGNQTTKAQNQINQQAADEGAALASSTFKDQANQLRLRDSQEAEASARDRANNAIKAAQARETLRVSSGEAGVSGVSVDNLLADYYRQEEGYNGALDRNLEFSQAQTTEELKGIRSGAIDRQIAQRRPMINPPSYLAAGLQVGAHAVGTYDSYKFKTDPAYRGER